MRQEINHPGTKKICGLAICVMSLLREMVWKQVNQKYLPAGGPDGAPHVDVYPSEVGINSFNPFPIQGSSGVGGNVQGEPSL